MHESIGLSAQAPRSSQQERAHRSAALSEAAGGRWRQAGALGAPQLLLRTVERAGSRWGFYEPQRIARIWVEDKATRFLHLCPVGPVERWLEESMATLTLRLRPLGFFRIHRQELINLHFLRSIERRPARAGGWRVRLRDGQEAPVSRRRTAALRRAIHTLLCWPPDASGPSVDPRRERPQGGPPAPQTWPA